MLKKQKKCSNYKIKKKGRKENKRGYGYLYYLLINNMFFRIDPIRYYILETN